MKNLKTKFTKEQILKTTISILAELAEVEENVTQQYVTEEDIQFWLKHGDDTDFIAIISKVFTFITLNDLQYVLNAFEQKEMYEECQILKEYIIHVVRYLKVENYIKNDGK